MGQTEHKTEPFFFKQTIQASLRKTAELAQGKVPAARPPPVPP